MGFTKDAVISALNHNRGNVQKSIEWLVSQQKSNNSVRLTRSKSRRPEIVEVNQGDILPTSPPEPGRINSYLI